MPTKTNTSERVYTRPKRPLQQAKLTSAKKVYGEKGRIPRHILNEEGQATVTQLWKGPFPEDENSVEEEDNDDADLNEEVSHKSGSRKRRGSLVEKYQAEDDDGSGEYGEKPHGRNPKRKPGEIVKIAMSRTAKRKSTGDIEPAAKKARKSRRKTEGEGSPEKSELHTQTLTQWNRSFTATSDLDADDNELPAEDGHKQDKEYDISGAEPGVGKSIYDVPSSSQSLHLPTSIQRFSSLESSKQASPHRNSGPSSEMPPPSTPRRLFNREIPSSQSPATPLSLPSGISRRHALGERSDNTPIPFNPNARRTGHVTPERPPVLEVKDTFETTQGSELSRVPSTPAKKLTPAKSVRFALAADQESQEIVSLSPSNEGANISSTPFPKSPMASRMEILDSDAESDDEDADLTVLQEEGPPRESSPILGDDSQLLVQEGEPETFYGVFGDETQIEAIKVVDSSMKLSSSMPPPSLMRPSPPPHSSIHPSVIYPILHDEGDDSKPETDEGASADVSLEETTQYMESQRLSTQYRRAMAPRTSESDVFISLPPIKVTQITTRTRDHDIRNWSFPPPVRRLWIYEAKPVQSLKYMVEIGPAKKPGQISDERGLDNATFNARGATSTWVAYEILQVYELADPQPWSELHRKGWLSKPPNRFNKVPPGVLSELMANIKAPLFDHDQDDADEWSSSVNDTQEAEAQLVSTIKEFKQASVPSKDVRSKTPLPQEQDDLSTAFRKPSSPSEYPAPSQATTVDCSQTQTPKHRSTEEVIWESPTRPIPPSSSVKLPSPRSGGSSGYRAHDSLLPFSMGSSQLLSKSQLLPDSLLVDGAGGPPLFIGDSEDEFDEEL